MPSVAHVCSEKFTSEVAASELTAASAFRFFLAGSFFEPSFILVDFLTLSFLSVVSSAATATAPMSAKLCCSRRNVCLTKVSVSITRLLV